MFAYLFELCDGFSLLFNWEIAIVQLVCCLCIKIQLPDIMPLDYY